MVYLVYIEGELGYSDVTLVGAFLMEEDAKVFMENSYLSNLLLMTKVEGWEHFRNLRNSI